MSGFEGAMLTVMIIALITLAFAYFTRWLERKKEK